MRAFAEIVVRHRLVVVFVSLAITVFLGLNLRSLNVIVDADELLPHSHPFVEVTERVQELFGNRYTVVIGVTSKQGDVYQPEVLGKVVRITERLAQTPGVNPANLQSLAAVRAKSIEGNADGLVVTRLLDQVPTDRAASQKVAEMLRQNPAYGGVLVSEDGRTAAVYAEFKKDPGGFDTVMSKVEAAVSPERDARVQIAVAGQPVFLAALETFSKRMAYLLPIAILLIGLIHLEAFRTIQGLVLPLVTAMLAVVWSLGLMSVAGTHLDPFNNVTPILILAVAAGHAVQVLKRYYEEFDRLSVGAPGDLRLASRQAVVEAMVRVGPVMVTAGGIAAMALMSLMIFDIQSIRTFGFFSGMGILSVIVIELTFTPAIRAMLPPPTKREQTAERKLTAWDRLAAWLAEQVSSPEKRRRVYVGWGVACTIFVVGASQVVVDNSLRGFFGESLQQRKDDKILNDALAGTNTFYVLVEGDSDDAIKDPKVLQAMEKVQTFLEAQPEIGHTLSMVDMLKQINMGMNGGAPAARVLPQDRELISQYLLLYSMSGEPGDFDGLVDYPYRHGIIQAFVKTDSSAFVARLDEELRPLIASSFPAGVRVRLGGSITTPTAMNESMVRDKLISIVQLLPPAVLGDRARFDQIVGNLLTNAIAYTERGAVSLAAEWSAGRAYPLTVIVEDTGPGIEPSQVAGLFDAFVLAPRPGQRSDGLGMGLHICAGLCTLMGGSVRFESREGGGSRFIVELALPETEVDVPCLASRSEPAMNILLIEDDPIVREVTHALLVRDGHQVCSVDGAAAALQAVSDVVPQLVLIDIQLGSGGAEDGIDLARRLREASAGGSALQIIASPQMRPNSSTRAIAGPASTA